jgi:hypothetical protein
MVWRIYFRVDHPADFQSKPRGISNLQRPQAASSASISTKMPASHDTANSFCDLCRKLDGDHK